MRSMRSPVVPAQAGTQRLLRESHWIPACAGMTPRHFAGPVSFPRKRESTGPIFLGDEAGRGSSNDWVPAFAGTTRLSVADR
jgi:hypothetical protein